MSAPVASPPAKPSTVPTVQYRTATFEYDSTRAAEDGDRTVALSLSSEAPCRMYGIEEILDHKPGSVRMERIKSAGPLLWNHDRNAVIGRLENVRLENGRLMATARFAPATNKLAEEKWRDVQAGILRETSIGYRVYAAKLETSTDEMDTYRVLDWEPFEGSIVSIPADCSVGAGRAASADSSELFNLPQNQSRQMDTSTSTTGTGATSATVTVSTPAPAPNADAIRTELRTSEAERMRKIDEIVDAHKAHKPEIVEAGRAAIRSGMSLEDFRHQVLTQVFKAQPAVSPAPSLDQMQRDGKRRYSLTNVIRSMVPDLAGGVDIGFERECSEAVRKACVGNGSRKSAFTVPSEVLGIGLRGADFDHTRADQQATVPSTGGYLVSTDLRDGVIDKLDNMTVIGRLGVQRMEGLQGNLTIARQTGGATAYWVAENGAITASNLTWDLLGLVPHTIGAVNGFSKQLITQNTRGGEAKVRRDLQLRLALGIDLAFFQGTGGAQPLGLFNQTLATTAGTPEAGKVSKITYGGAAEFGDFTNVIAQLLTANAPITNVRHVISPSGYGKLSVKSVDTGSGVFVWQGSAENGTIAGYPAMVSNHLPGANGGQSAHGAWGNAIWASWGGLDITVDPYSLAPQQLIKTTMFDMVDFAFEHLEAFVVSTDGVAQ